MATREELDMGVHNLVRCTTMNQHQFALKLPWNIVKGIEQSVYHFRKRMIIFKTL